jgi:hypothetical protein
VRKCPKCESDVVVTEKSPDGNSKCLSCNYSAPTTKFDVVDPRLGDGVKTETMEIKFARKECDLRCNYAYVPLKHKAELFKNMHPNCTLTLSFEMPVPEKEATISESMIDKAVDKFCSTPHEFLLLSNFLKRELLGSERV